MDTIEAGVLEADPNPVDAGAPLVLRAVWPESAGELPGRQVVFRDAGGSVIAEAALEAKEDGSLAASCATFAAPAQAGVISFTAEVAGSADEGPAAEPLSTTVTVTAHAAYAMSWGVQPAVTPGGQVAFMVGLKCSCGCDLTGRAFTVTDGTGAEVARGVLGAEIWPGTTAVRHAAVTAQAPDAVGRHEWTVTFEGTEGEVPHDGGTTRFRVNVVAEPEHELVVEVVDKDTGAPLAGAHVVLHPYRTVTDAVGRARLSIAGGNYRLSVSGGGRYLSYTTTIEAKGNDERRIELAMEPEGLDDLRY